MTQLSILSSSEHYQQASQAIQLAAEDSTSLDELVVARLNKPQRHRLLHGFPLAASMPILTNEYMQVLKEPLPFWSRYFDFDQESFKLLYVTRQLSKLTVQSDAYRALLGSDVLSDYDQEWKALARQNLIEIDGACIRLTARGMFFSDTVASVLSHRHHAARLERTTAERQFLEGNQSGHM